MLWGGKEGGGSADSLVLEAQSFPCWSTLWLHHSLWGKWGPGGCGIQCLSDGSWVQQKRRLQEHWRLHIYGID